MEHGVLVLNEPHQVDSTRKYLSIIGYFDTTENVACIQVTKRRIGSCCGDTIWYTPSQAEWVFKSVEEGKHAATLIANDALAVWHNSPSCRIILVNRYGCGREMELDPFQKEFFMQQKHSLLQFIEKIRKNMVNTL